MYSKQANPHSVTDAGIEPHFNRAGLQFLRGLARNNDRDWFEARRPIFEREIKARMLAIIAHVTDAMAGFAPAHVRPPEKILMRIYRDTRFSSDKRPYKTHTAAWWALNGAPKTSGAGYYLHVSGKEVEIAAGVYMPTAEQLFAIRTHLLAHHAEYRRVLRSKAIASRFVIDEGAPLSRVPKGFPADHAAADLVRQRRWGVHAAYPAEFAATPGFRDEIVGCFRAASPLITLLNAPLGAANNTKRKPLFGLP